MKDVDSAALDMVLHDVPGMTVHISIALVTPGDESDSSGYVLVHQHDSEPPPRAAEPA